MHNRFAEKKLWMVFIAVLVLPRLICLWVPILAIDEAIYAVFAGEILQGTIPYEGLVDYKPPLIFYFYALAFKLGVGMLGVHIMHLGIVALTCWVLFKLASHLAGRHCGWFAAIFYAGFSTTWDSQQFLATNGESLMVLPLCLAVYYLWKSEALARPLKDSLQHLFICGLFLGLAFITKYTSGINIFLSLGYLALGLLLAKKYFKFSLGAGKPSLVTPLLKFLALGLGALVPVALLIGYFVNVGTWKDFYFWGWQYNRSYISQGAALVTWDYFLLKFIARTGLLALAGWLLLGILTTKTLKNLFQTWKDILQNNKRLEALKDWHLLFVGFWLVISFIPVSLGGRLFYHYYIQILPPLCLLAAVSAAPLWKAKKARVLIITLGLIPFFFFMTKNILQAFPKEEPMYKKVAQYIKTHSQPSDAIFVWGYLPKIYYFSNRPPASRFVFCQFLSGSSPKHNGMDFDSKTPDQWPNAFERVIMEFTHDQPRRDYDTRENIVPGAWDLLFEDFEKNRPKFIVDTSPTNVNRYAKYPLRKFPKFLNYIQENYALVETIDQADIYQLK